MEVITYIVQFFFHIDKYLNVVIQNCGVWSYAILFAIVFAETGLVITPFLPGDSLLFAVGTFASTGAFNIIWVSLVLFAAAVIGDSVNYAVGKRLGEGIFKENGRFFKKEYLKKTHMFYEKYGGKTIVLARFVPIVRTFAPFVAGVGKMSYGHFFSYNVIGAFLWVALFAGGGFFFGNTPFIRKNFSFAILVIIFISILPPIIEIRKHHRNKKMAGK
ncbi:MAG: DedA family protein [Candidatus Omnitrophota bacterium]|nr:DedA family protein [Candidatus Omnitrophota bacterium]